MRATFFQKPYEYKLDIVGEQWHQGEVVKGKLDIKTIDYMDQSSEAELGVFLCLVDLKKFKNKSEKSVTMIQEKVYSDFGQFEFSFNLESGCYISEKNVSICLLVGNKNDIFNCGVMQLKIVPQKHFQDFIEIFETFYRFKLKSIKSKKSEIEYVFTPPASKDFTHITKFSMYMTLDGASIDKIWHITTIASINKLSLENFQTQTKEEVISFSKEFTPKQYIAFGTQINKEFFIGYLKELLEGIKLKPLI